MIFVTVGTHEQGFDRLLKEIDKLIEKGIIKEEVFIQTGFSEYEPKNCNFNKLISYKKMKRMVTDARIIITHGGPASFVMPLQLGKIPIVVPRQQKFNEHINDHQLEFAKVVSERNANIILIEDIESLGEIIIKYDELVKLMPKEIVSNNMNFNEKFNEVLNELYEKK